MGFYILSCLNWQCCFVLLEDIQTFIHAVMTPLLMKKLYFHLNYSLSSTYTEEEKNYINKFLTIMLWI